MITITKSLLQRTPVVLFQYSRKYGNMSDLTTIFLSGVNSVQPKNLLRNTVRIENRNLSVANQSFPISKPCYVVGFGKAVLGMAVELENILAENLCYGIVTVPVGIQDTFRNLPDLLPSANSRVRFIEGAEDNLPDLKAFNGAKEIRNLAAKLGEDDLLIVLISGGGSALLPYPKSPMTLYEESDLIKALSMGGADIKELNTVRKKLSDLKGGGLVKVAKPAKVIGLILSDIVGDPLDLIASGPTVEDLDEDEAALNVVKKYRLYEGLPNHIKGILLSKNYRNSEDFVNVSNFIIGSNKIAANACKLKAETLGYETTIISTNIDGNVQDISKFYAELSYLISVGEKPEIECFLNKLNIHSSDLASLDFTKRICIIGAGETTVAVSGKGKGGRNQELALRVSLELNKLNAGKMADISFLSAGTDGMDGPTDAAGALGSSNLVNKAAVQGISPSQFLRNNDSYNFYTIFDEGSHLIKTGHTGTNVMDLHLLLIDPMEKCSL